MTGTPQWRVFEDHVNALLGLDGTVASGSQFHDKGDGVDRRHYSLTGMALQVDAKCSTGVSFRVSGKLMRQYCLRAAESGKRFVMAIRLIDQKTRGAEDYAVLRLDDLAELLECYRKERE